MDADDVSGLLKDIRTRIIEGWTPMDAALAFRMDECIAWLDARAAPAPVQAPVEPAPAPAPPQGDGATGIAGIADRLNGIFGRD